MIYGLLTTLKDLLSIILQVKNEKEKIDFYRFQEIYIRSSYYKLLLNQRYVVCDKYIFLCSSFKIATRFLNLIVNLRD